MPSAPITERIERDTTPTMTVDGTTVAPQPPRVIEVGTVLSGRYMIERAIGSGGMSTVFSALDRHRMQGPAADAKVAVKVLNRALLSDQGRVQRLIREFRYMQRLTHRGIVRVFDLDCDEGTWFITMEMLQGQPLTQYLHRHKPYGLPADDALRLLIECTEALVCAHDHGVIHGDFKPGNIFLDEKGAARLLDFGSVPEKDEPADAPRDRFLTPAYASPQMLDQQSADLRDDLFSLGCVAYELFSGQHPFKSMSSLEAREEGLRLTWVPSIPACHFGVIARMLSWERDDRPANGREFLDSLTAAQVRAKTAFTREPRPAEPASSPVHSRSSRQRATNQTTARAHEPSPAGRHESRHRAATPEELNRAFAQFSGVVPEGWVGAGAEHSASAPAGEKGVSAEALSAATEPAKERWSKAIPPEWLEPKPKLDESAIPASSSAQSEAAAVEEPATASDPEQARKPAATRAVPWLSQLRWNNASVLNRIRRSSRTSQPPSVAPAAAKAQAESELQSFATQAQPAQTKPQVAAQAPAPAPAPAPARRSPTLLLRSTTPVSWSTLASRLRTLRVRAATRTVAPQLESASIAVMPAVPHLVQPGWIPQLQWRNEIAIRWPDVQATAAVTPHVHFGTLPPPAEKRVAPVQVAPVQVSPVPPAAAAIIDMPRAPRVDWRKAIANLSRVSAESRDRLRAQAARMRSHARTRAAPAMELAAATPDLAASVETAPPETRSVEADQTAEPSVVAVVPTALRPLIDWHGLADTLARESARLRDQLRTLAAKVRQRGKEFDLLPHWVQLRRTIGSLASTTTSRERLPLNAWLIHQAPRWREAVPATAIVGIAFVAWGLLQGSAASRSDVAGAAEGERLVAARLQQLAEAPIDLTLPIMADLALPTIRVEQRAPAPAAPGFISFQSAKIHVGAGQKVAVVGLRRNKSTDGSAPFGWRIAPGTARPGIDYEQPKIQIARFNDGQDVRSVFIPIKPAKAGGRPERRFTIQLTKTPGGPAFGEITEAEVVIEGSG